MSRLATRADADASLDPDRIVLLGEAGRDRDALRRSGTRTPPRRREYAAIVTS
jgi:hypothetical protein